MKSITLFFILLFLYSPLALLSKEPRILEWDEMMPEGYLESLLEYNDSSFSATDAFSFDDATEEAQQAYDKLRSKLESAPVVHELENQYVKLAGFIVPLDFDFDSETFKTFLLVPYFGACIHTPPPPSNQIVHISSSEALNQEWLDYAVWASGVISTKSKASEMAFAAYSIENVSLEEYTEEEE